MFASSSSYTIRTRCGDILTKISGCDGLELRTPTRLVTKTAQRMTTKMEIKMGTQYQFSRLVRIELSMDRSLLETLLFSYFQMLTVE